MAVITRSSYVLQTILIPKGEFNAKTAAKWCADRGYKHNKIDVDDNYYRFRQRSPNNLDSYSTRSLANGIKLVFAKRGQIH